MRIYKNLLLIVSFALFVNDVYSQEQLQREKEDYIPSHVELILWDEFSPTDLYDTVGSEKNIRCSMLAPRDSTTMQWWILTVYEKKDNMLKVSFWNMDNLDDENSDIYHGWIFMDNLAVYPVGHFDENIGLYDSIYAQQSTVSFRLFDESTPENLKVVDVDLKSKWVKIKWKDQKEYWISYKNQCTNHYTACLGN